MIAICVLRRRAPAQNQPHASGRVVKFPGKSFAAGPAAALHWRGDMFPKRQVYILKDKSDPRRYYTGVTSDIGARVAAHNAGRCRHTASSGPWTVDVLIEFADERRAIAFEHYLKSGSGVAFAKTVFAMSVHRRKTSDGVLNRP